MGGIIVRELKDIIDQLEVVSYDDCTNELSTSENALVIVGNVQKLNDSSDFIIVSPLNDYKRKFQFKTQDIENIEKIDNKVFKVFIKDDSSCIVMSNGRTKKSNARAKRRKKFDFEKMKFHSIDYGVAVCDIYCDSCVVGPCECDSCYTDCHECICDCNYVA
jgi:hypothetical protein